MIVISKNGVCKGKEKKTRTKFFSLQTYGEEKRNLRPSEEFKDISKEINVTLKKLLPSFSFRYSRMHVLISEEDFEFVKKVIIEYFEKTTGEPVFYIDNKMP